MKERAKFNIVFIIIFFVLVFFLGAKIELGNENIQKKEISKKITKNNEESISVKILDNFKSIDSLEDFKKIRELYGLDNIMLIAVKSNNLELWKKYWLLKYDYYIEKKDKYFLNNIKQFGAKPKEGFLKILEEKFLEIQKGITYLSKDDLNMDINVYFNRLSLKDALENCSYLRKKFPNKYKGDNYSCEDKIYFYRATKENKYCDKILDNYRKELCKDFLDYQENKK